MATNDSKFSTTTERISALFNNNVLFNTRPRNIEGTLDEEEENSNGSSSGYESPVHNMNEKALKLEAYIGYFIASLTTIFLSLLIFGYAKTTDIPLCMCSNNTDIGDDLCLDAKPLTPAEKNECDSKCVLS